MKRIIVLLLLAIFCLNAEAQKKVVKSKTHYAEDVLRPYVESGEQSSRY